MRASQGEGARNERSIAAVPIQERLERAAKFRGQIVVLDRPQQRDRRLVCFQLRQAPRAGGEMPLEGRMHARRQLMLDEIGEEHHQILAAPHRAASHRATLATLAPFILAQLLQHSALSLQHRKDQKSYPIHTAKRGLRNHSLPLLPSRMPW